MNWKYEKYICFFGGIFVCIYLEKSRVYKIYANGFALYLGNIVKSMWNSILIEFQDDFVSMSML